MEQFTTDSKKTTLEDCPRILIVEDNQYRIDLFKTHWGGQCRIHIFETAWPAITMLKALKFDAILLDHDLGGRQFVTDDALNGTGYDVAKIIPDTINKDTPVVVHSVNPVGAQRMVAAIGPTATHVPFSADLFNIVKFH